MTKAAPIARSPADEQRRAPGLDCSLGRSSWALYTLSLRQHLHGRRWMGMLVLTVLPMLIAILMRCTDSYAAPQAIEFGLIFMLIPQGLLPLLALVYASGVIRDEQEEQTITYILVRPIPKWLIYLLKLAAAITMAEVLTVTAIVLTYTAIYCGVHGVPAALSHATADCLVACGVHGLAILAYCGIFGLMGLVTRRVLVVGILYTALFEGLFANIPFNLRMITVIYYARLLICRLLPHGTHSGFQVYLTAARGWHFITSGDSHLKLYPHNGVCVIVLVSTAILTSGMAAWICNNQEYYVKTSGKPD